MEDTTQDVLLGYDINIEPEGVDENMAKKAGEFCAMFRKEFLRLSQTKLAEMNGLESHNLSAFENGRSTNLNYLYLYYKASTNKLQQDVFKKNVFDL